MSDYNLLNRLLGLGPVFVCLKASFIYHLYTLKKSCHLGGTFEKRYTFILYLQLKITD